MFSNDTFEKRVWGTVRAQNLINHPVGPADIPPGERNAGGKVCAAVSGGADSMALLYFLCKYRDRLGGLSAVNIDHGIRGAESARDSEFVAAYCRENNIPLMFYKSDVPGNAKRDNMSIETAARAARYKIFEALLNGAGAPDYIATAHHLNDNAESVLLHLFRGGGARGLSGMEYVVRGRYIRPLLDVSRREIEEYVKTNKIPFVEDATNADIYYTRNFVRHEIMSRIEERFPGAAERIVAAARDVGKDDEFLNRWIDNGQLKEKGNNCQLKLGLKEGDIAIALSALAESALAPRAVFAVLRKLGINEDVERRHIEIILDFASKGKNGSALDMPDGLRVRKEHGRIVFRKTKNKQ